MISPWHLCEIKFFTGMLSASSQQGWQRAANVWSLSGQHKRANHPQAVPAVPESVPYYTGNQRSRQSPSKQVPDTTTMVGCWMGPGFYPRPQEWKTGAYVGQLFHARPYVHFTLLLCWFPCLLGKSDVKRSSILPFLKMSFSSWVHLTSLLWSLTVNLALLFIFSERGHPKGKYLRIFPCAFDLYIFLHNFMAVIRVTANRAQEMVD